MGYLCPLIGHGVSFDVLDLDVDSVWKLGMSGPAYSILFNQNVYTRLDI